MTQRSLEKENAKLKAENAKLRAALSVVQFYIIAALKKK